jgi:CHAT domain-containing protein/tetratricopeptide (TPR) repeat protein
MLPFFFAQDESSLTTSEALTRLAEMLSAPALREREQRVQVYRDALHEVSRDERPAFWAALQISLAQDLLDDRSRFRAASLEEAIEGLAGAAQAFLESDLPIPWAEACTMRAGAYLDRIRGSRRENVEAAIELCRKAFKVQTRRSRPAFWVEVADYLASALSARHPRTIYLEKSVRLYRRVLDVRQKETDDPVGWANAATNLAKTLAERIQGDRAQDLEEAIDLLRHAERILAEKRPASPRRPTVLINLAMLYRERLRGDLTANQEQAMEILTALLAQTDRLQLLDRARALHLLAALYSERARGRRDRNLEQAIEHYRQALAIHTLEDLPQRWAETTQNLATVYVQRPLGEHDRNLEQAATLYRQVLDQLDPQEAPEDWSLTTSNLATVYADRLTGEPKQNLQEAVALYRQVLEVRRRDADPLGWALTQVNLGNAFARLDVLGEPGAFDAALDAYRQALEVHEISSLPGEHRRTQGNLADLFFGRQHWHEALDTYNAALAAGEAIYQSAATPEARRAALRASLDFSTRAACCLVRVGRPAEAVVLLERSRTRSLNEALGQTEALLQRLTNPVRTALLRAREQIASLEAQSRRLHLAEREEFLRITEELSRHRSKLAEIVQEIRRTDPDFLADGTTPAAVLSLVSQLGVPLIYLFTTLHGTVGVLVRTEGEIESFSIDGFQQEHLRALLQGAAGKPSYLSHIIDGDPEPLQQALDSIGPILQERLLSPLAGQLAQRGFSRACLVPCGSLGLLPLTALAPEGLVLHLIPSARALETARLNRQRREDKPARLLAVGNPLSRSRPLAFAALEAREISELFPQDRRQVLLGSMATLARVRDGMTGATHLHLSCHGQFLLDEPLDSSLELSGGELLRLRDLFDPRLDLTSMRLVVLSACQTGITDQELPDEALGFPAVFLQAGVPATVSTLWPVPDGPTAFLLIRFYQNLFEDPMEPALALCQARRWLRTATAHELRLVERCERVLEETKGTPPRSAYLWQRRYRQQPEAIPFAHPYFWAGFVVTGL